MKLARPFVVVLLTLAGATAASVAQPSPNPTSTYNARGRYDDARRLLEANEDAAAEPILREVIDRAPTDAVTEYAVSLLLDLFNRQARYGDMVELAGRVVKTPALHRGRPDLLMTARKLVESGPRRRAEALERQATASDRAADYVACGEAYAALARTAGRTSIDEVRYNAGVCFERGKAVDRAVMAYRGILKTSALASRARWRAGQLLIEAGQVEDGVVDLKAAIAALPSPRRATPSKQWTQAGPDNGLSRAEPAAFDGPLARPDMQLDLAGHQRRVGDLRGAIATLKTAWAEAARDDDKVAVGMALVAALESAGDPRAFVKHLEAMLRQVALSPAQRADLALRRGQAMLRAACAGAVIDGVCTTRKAPRRAGARCGASMTLSLPAAQARGAKRVAEATIALQQVIKLGGRAPKDEAEVREAGLLAQVALAELKLDAVAQLPRLTGLDFTSGSKAAERSQAKFEAWLGDLTSRTEALREALFVDASTPDARAALAWRVFAHGHLRAAHALQTIEVPANVRKFPEAQAAFCDAIADKGRPLVNAAADALRTCVERATAASLDDVRQACAQTLGQLNPSAP